MQQPMMQQQPQQQGQPYAQFQDNQSYPQISPPSKDRGIKIMMCCTICLLITVLCFLIAVTALLVNLNKTASNINFVTTVFQGATLPATVQDLGAYAPGMAKHLTKFANYFIEPLGNSPVVNLQIIAENLSLMAGLTNQFGWDTDTADNGGGLVDNTANVLEDFCAIDDNNEVWVQLGEQCLEIVKYLRTIDWNYQYSCRNAGVFTTNGCNANWNAPPNDDADTALNGLDTFCTTLKGLSTRRR